MPGDVAHTPAEADLPLIISVDDHVMEPKDLWQRELPASLRDRGPRVVRERVKLEFTGGHYGFTRGAPDGDWCDVWLFDDLVTPTGLLHAPAGMPREEQRNVPATYDDFRPGTYDQAARLADMDLNHVEAAINYPNIFPRFAGQGFLERADKDLALACLRIYN
ncbi:MAG: amidohydrolase, partial [Acidimicrobiales bacterium]|nr:amidohydrolase [Acidimicrobiales bacterium]